MSEEWVHFKIQSSDSSRSTSLASLRNKIRRHETSRAHKIAQELTEKGGQDLVGNLVRAVSETVFAETDSVFRTAYYLAKMNQPFTDHDSLIELQEKNGANMGTSLHSRYSYTKIVEHIAKEMQKKIVHSIVTSSSKLSVLIDEATSISHKSAMIVNLKVSVDGATLEFLFLELVELESQRAKDIEEALLNCLDTAGFTEEWLQNNWVSFVSDGASVMLGKNSGVARVELAVSDAVDEVQAVNHFKVFLEKIHNLYSQSNKNARTDKRSTLLLSNICGVALIVVGILVQVAIHDSLSIVDSTASAVPIVLIVVGVVIFFIAFFGCCGAWKENYCLVTTFSILLFLIILAEIGVAIAGYIFRDHLKCCGANSSMDWINFSTDRKTVPDSCCVNISKGCGVGKLTDPVKVHQQGCHTAIEEILADNLTWIIIAAIVIAAIQILGIVFSCVLMKGIRTGYEVM
ncbi:hypothetical protein NHX12_012450 [Muraenolepis orangiensis]|uniref:Tetraspanin n=1 Tax=Muraenolepis orangiensis TaxID=630683 RepID=A0A9Q0DCR4_9TELE|nr:hypothetical protein NHX12_012450 [Muraenolepis orangiensis]